MKKANDWHLVSYSDCVKMLSTDVSRGLSEKEAAKRLKRGDCGAVWRVKKLPAWSFTAVFDVATLLLVVSAVSAAMLDKSRDALWIVAILVLGALVRTLTYVRANKIIESCARAKIPVSSVIRDGRVSIIPADEVTVGDIVLLETGDTVPCDGRVVSGGTLTVSEKGVTENTTPVKKFNTVIRLAEGSQDVPCEYRSNILFAGSIVLSGSVKMAATACGEDTLVVMRTGGIVIDPELKLKALDRLKKYSRSLSLVMLAGVMVLTALSIFMRGANGIPEVFLASMAMAVAAMSEFLPAVGYIAAAVSLRDASEKTGGVSVVIKESSCLGGIGKAEKIVFSDTSYLKSGDAVISSYSFCGKTWRNTNTEGQNTPGKEFERLVSLAMCASMNPISGITGADSVGGEVRLSDTARLSSLAADVYTRAAGKSIDSSEAAVDHRGGETEGSMGNDVSLIVEDGEFYAVAAGKIADILSCCTSYAGEDGVKPLDDKAHRRIFTDCAREEVGGGRVVAVARRVSQFQSLNRLPVLTQYMTFVGYFALAESEERGCRENVRYIKSRGIKPVVFSRNPQADLYYASAVGLLSRETKTVSAAEIVSTARGNGEFGVGDKGLLVSFEGIDEKRLARTETEVMRRLGGKKTIVLGRRAHSSGALSAAEYPIAVSRSSYRTIPYTLSSDACALVHVSENGGGCEGAVRILKTADRTENNLDSAKYYVIASQTARLVMMLASVIFGLPMLSAVFILLWGLIFDFAASLVMAFVPYSGRHENKTEVNPVLTGFLWGALLALSEFLVSLTPSGSGGKCLTVLAAAVVLSSYAVSASLSRCVASNTIHSAYTLVSLALASFIALTKTGASISAGEVCGTEALIALIPAAAASAILIIPRLIKKHKSADK